MQTTQTPQQLAALWVQLDGYTNPKLRAVGQPGNWSVCLDWDEPETHEYKLAWLASTRHPTDMRNFKTLDAAMKAATEVCRLAAPALKSAPKFATLKVDTRLDKDTE